jgi:hypothetical protein
LPAASLMMKIVDPQRVVRFSEMPAVLILSAFS